MLEGLKDGKKAVGIKQTLKAVENGAATTVFIASDADEKVVGKLKELCSKTSVQIAYADSMKLLGKACSIEVGAAAAALLK